MSNTVEVTGLKRAFEQGGARIEVLMDGGVMRGSDVVKALALGADAVSNMSTWRRLDDTRDLATVVVVMFGFGYLLVPFYERICEVTGLRDIARADVGQVAPEGRWLHWLILAGRGYGKTRTGAEWVRRMAAGDPADRVYGLAPGAMLPSFDQVDAEHEVSGRMNLLRRLTQPQELADAALFLSEGWLTSGETIFVDSGQHLLSQPRDVLYLARA